MKEDDNRRIKNRTQAGVANRFEKVLAFLDLNESTALSSYTLHTFIMCSWGLEFVITGKCGTLNSSQGCITSSPSPWRLTNSCLPQEQIYILFWLQPHGHSSLQHSWLLSKPLITLYCCPISLCCDTLHCSKGIIVYHSRLFITNYQICIISNYRK